MTNKVYSSRLITISLLLMVMIFSLFTFESLGRVDAYAATMAKPSVSISNASSTSVKISWKKVKGAKKYVVYRSLKKNSNFKAVKSTTATSFTNTKLSCGKVYYYKITAVNGNQKSTSAVKSITVKPAKVSGVKTSVTCSSATVKWTKASGVTGYQVYSSSSKSGKYTLYKSVKANSLTQKNLKLSAAKYYKVRAYKTVSKKNVYGAFSDIVSAKTKHAPSSAWFIDEKASCVKKGVKSNTCKYCDKEMFENIDIDPSAHSLVTTTTDASCTNDGLVTVSCKLCKKVFSKNVLASTGHNPVSADNAVASSCTTDGHEADTKCSKCNVTLKNGAVIPATGHKEISADNTVAPTCTADGHNSDTICEICNTVITEGSVIPATGHIEVLRDDALEPSCTVAGHTASSYCFVCKTNLSDGEELPLNEHTPVCLNNSKEPTCCENGKEADYICLECKEVLYIGEEIPATGEHGYVVKEYVTEGATTEIIYICIYCGETFSEYYEFEDHEHVWTEYEGIEPSCADFGVETYYACECGAVKGGATIPMTEHQLSEWEAVDDEYEQGVHVRGCEICGAYYESGNCDYGDFVIEQEPGYAEEGYGYYECKICGGRKMVSIPVKYCDHEGTTEIINASAPSCADKGYSGDTYCKRCNIIVFGGYAIASKPHTPVDADNETQATCTTNGHKSDTICAVCNQVIVKGETLTAGGHVFGDYVVNDEGKLEYTCGECGSVKTEAVCIIDLTNRTITTQSAKPSLATFGVSDSGNDKLDIVPDGEFSFEIVGKADNMSIHIDTDKDAEIKLCGVEINNDGRDVFDIEKTGDVIEIKDGVESARTPEVSISAKDGTVNNIVVLNSGNAFDSDCSVAFKGHGVLNVDTASTALSITSKVSFKNLTINIKSGNRGIDTKLDTTVINELTNEPVVVTNYFNVKVGSNADITINSVDDCIRCKNMEIGSVSEGDTASVIHLTSTGGDGIQIEGNTGFTAESGDITINAFKYVFNCKMKKINIKSSGVKLKTTGTYCKPE